MSARFYDPEAVRWYGPPTPGAWPWSHVTYEFGPVEISESYVTYEFRLRGISQSHVTDESPSDEFSKSYKTSLVFGRALRERAGQDGARSLPPSNGRAPRLPTGRKHQ